MARRLTLTQHLRALEEATVQSAPAPERFEFGNGRYTIRVANDFASRRKAYEMVYRLYLEKEYAQPHPSKMWLSVFDALPETVTLLVERTAVEGRRLKVEGMGNQAPSALGPQPHTPVGALTVVFDSPMGLPADNLYKPELDAMRASGRRAAEIVSLGVAEEASAGSQVLVKLFNFAYFVARGLRGTTDFVNTVNPRHVRFYQRLMLFSEAGPERAYDKVGGAPACLLRLDLDRAERQRETPVAGAAACRSIYDQFRSVGEEPETVGLLAGQLRPMTAWELDRFFVRETDVMVRATPEQREHIRAAYAAREMKSAAGLSSRP